MILARAVAAKNTKSAAWQNMHETVGEVRRTLGLR
jgi:hypothetical protein